MSFNHQNIQAFIQLLEAQSSLLSSQDKVDLKQLGETLPKAIEPISNAIAAWYQDRPHILNTQLAIMTPLSSNDITRGAGGTPPPEITPEDERKLREQLINAIRRNTPAASQESKPKTDSSQSSR
ncbi:hypothetical protein [Candidatus Parabeggiatoa sp. HSG14]|uniref:hypothetical protein n=1 Tax=Candidatus Parabeggiatoa sp. HSG14 TaxID=3055593 RepID=UPI0025A805AC|nr:hypothetical protein [Thiotrichales bacterium HSG14]